MESATPESARSPTNAPFSGVAHPPTRQGLWLAVVVLTALNLRPFLTAVGPLTSDIAAATGLDLRAMAWLTQIGRAHVFIICTTMPCTRGTHLDLRYLLMSFNLNNF